MTSLRKSPNHTNNFEGNDFYMQMHQQTGNAQSTFQMNKCIPFLEGGKTSKTEAIYWTVALISHASKEMLKLLQQRPEP